MCEWTHSSTHCRRNMQCFKTMVVSDMFCSRANVHMHVMCSVVFRQDNGWFQWAVCVCVCVCCERQWLACSRADFSRSPGSRSHSHWEWEQFSEHTPTQCNPITEHACTQANVGGKLCFTQFSSQCTPMCFLCHSSLYIVRPPTASRTWKWSSVEKGCLLMKKF